MVVHQKSIGVHNAHCSKAEEHGQKGVDHELESAPADAEEEGTLLLRQRCGLLLHRRYHDEPGDRLGRIGRVRHTWIDNED